MEITASKVAEWIGGEVIGNGSAIITDFGKIEEASGSGCLTFLANEKYHHFLKDSTAGVIIISRGINFNSDNSKTYIQVEDAYSSMTHLLNLYQSIQSQKSGIESPVSIHESAQLGENPYIGAFAVIGKNVKIGNNCKIYPQTFIDDNVVLGDNCTLYSGVKIYKDCLIGNNAVIHSGSIIGSDGFGFQPDAEGVFHKVPQVGNVIIKDNVEIGSCCTIDRATMGSTIIESGVKLDNQIQIAHNVYIGKNTVIASQSGVAGSTKIGQNNMIGGQVGIAGHLKVGDFVQIQAQSGINTDIEDQSKLYGSPAINAMDFRKSYVFFRKLPDLVKRIQELEKSIKENKHV